MSARSAAMPSTPVWPAGRSTRTRSNTSPPRPTIAAARESTAISKREHDRAVRIDPDDRGGPTGRALRLGTLLDDEVGRGELADQRTDRAAGQAGTGDQLGARGRTAVVELADDRAQVRAMDRLATLAEGLEPHRHRFVFLSYKRCDTLHLMGARVKGSCAK